MIITKKIVNGMACRIVGCAIEVHKLIGPGLLESVYETCYVRELTDNNFYVKRQVPIPIIYKGRDLGTTLIMDLLVND
ncbi:MAG: GxxExxY protein [Ignavibacteria bacterium]